MYPTQDALQHVIKASRKVAWQKGGKTLPLSFFSWMNTTTQARSLKVKTTIFKIIPEEKQQLMEEKDADAIRELLCKSFIQWFWQLNLCSYKYWVNFFDSLCL